MKIETEVRVDAPVATAYEFFMWLDHLRLISPGRRREWCPEVGRRLVEGLSHEVCLEQGRHRVRLRFRTQTLRPSALIEDVFITWPLHGAKRVLRFERSGTGTRIIEEDDWHPPFYVRSMVAKRVESQRALFQEKLDRAAEVVSKAYAARGSRVFAGGVLEPATNLGILDDDDPLRHAGA